VGRVIVATRGTLAIGLCVLAAGCATTGTRGERSGRAGGPLNLPDHFRSLETLTAHGMVTVLLGMWHDAAARGDFDAYFSRMTDDGVFLGTDRTERWTRDEFEAFARPYFDGVEAWTYESVERHVIIGPGDAPAIAWFDEVLWNDKYGHCRGTGVAERGDDGSWRIAHYGLAFLIPNEKSAAVMDAIGPRARPAGD
jgi:ketosteroid isomerase-like protein